MMSRYRAKNRLPYQELQQVSCCIACINWVKRTEKLYARLKDINMDASSIKRSRVKEVYRWDKPYLQHLVHVSGVRAAHTGRATTLRRV